ncbi:TPA: hypothetical protein I8Y21_001298 [Klebsiella oxytoca]|uniref:Uncharacterized protein n=1 Tax=Klebsiella oxytoca TaxID=571 RepID=A0AAN5L6M3_KLEOX|nr:hypothetical protein [Klebsiella oxytoca]
MNLGNPVLRELIEMAVDKRAVVQLNDICARVTFLCYPDEFLVVYIGYAFDEPVPAIWRGEIPTDETRMTPDEFKTLMGKYSYCRGFV